MSTNVEKLEELTGLKRGQMDEIWQTVKANKARLDSCTGPHDFSIEFRKLGQFVRDWECSRCHGHVESIYKHWYELGLKHGDRK